MNSNSIFSKRWMGLDKGVGITMITLMILSAGLLSYRLANNEECKPVSFTIKSMDSRGVIFTAGELISFNAGSNDPEISWNFGDNSPMTKGGYVTHKYDAGGNYNITAYNNGGCESNKLITIKKPLPNASTTAGNTTITGEEIVGPSATTAGTEALFSCMVNASNYDWSIVNYPKLTRNGIAAKFSFPHAGKFTVQVTLDNDRSKRYTKEVLVEEAAIVKSTVPNQKPVPLIPADLAVLPMPERKNPEIEKPAAQENNEPAPTANKKLRLADATFISYLDKVASHEMTLADFDKYLCGGGTTKVVVNGDTKDMKNFSWLVQEVGQRKGPKVESASLNRADDCVTLILVKFKKKKGFLGL